MPMTAKGSSMATRPLRIGQAIRIDTHISRHDGSIASEHRYRAERLQSFMPCLGALRGAFVNTLDYYGRRGLSSCLD